jgi:hypothetical protein
MYHYYRYWSKAFYFCVSRDENVTVNLTGKGLAGNAPSAYTVDQWELDVSSIEEKFSAL